MVRRRVYRRVGGILGPDARTSGASLRSSHRFIGIAAPHQELPLGGQGLKHGQHALVLLVGSSALHNDGSERAVEVRAASLLEPPGGAFFAVVPGCGTERVVSTVRGVVCGWPRKDKAARIGLAER